MAVLRTFSRLRRELWAMMVASMQADAHLSKGTAGGFVAHGLAARLTKICAGLAFGIAALVMGFHLFVPAQTMLAGPAMRPNAALCLLLLSSAQLRLLHKQSDPRADRIAFACGALVGTIAGLTLLEHMAELDFGIDALILDLHGRSRMSWVASFALLCLGLATSISALRVHAALLTHTLLLLTGLCSLLPILGYVYRAPFLYGSVTGVAPGSAVSMLCLGVGFVALRGDGLWPLLVGNSAGSRLLRRALPAVVLLPIAFGWLRLEAEQHGNLGHEVGVALIAVATVLSFASLLIWSARWLRTEEALRHAALDNLREARDTLETRVEARTRELQQSEAELRRAATKLLAAKDAAESAMRARSDFLARMSHEMRTPLNGVVGMLEIALRSGLSTLQRGHVQTARSSADALLSLINDILDFSKMDAGKLQLEATTFRLRDCVAEAISDSLHDAHQKGLELYLCVDSNVPECLVFDRQRLRQVITNLVANAVKFTQQGEVKISVTLQRRTHTEVELEFEVADTGVGIPREKQTEIFQAFTQADETTTRRFGGTGLGLAISAQLVQLMGGTISVESEPDKGSRFSFRVEVGIDHEAELELDASRAAFAGKRALLVDAQPIHRELVSALLERWGIEAVNTPAGAAHRRLREAREQSVPFSFLLLDEQAVWSLGASYFQTLREVSGARFPIILLTRAVAGDGSHELRSKYVSAQLTKPIVSSELFETVAGLLTDIAADGSVALASEQQAPLSVLLAEDNEVNRRVACFLLQDVGYEVVAVEDGRKAVAALAARSFDVVLMDGHMPHMDGLEATHEIRRQERGTGRHTPIIALTAQAMKGDRERYIAAGMDGYLTKPFQSAELYAAIREAVAKNPSSALRAQAMQNAKPKISSRVSPAPERPRASPGVYERSLLLARLRGMENVLQTMVQIFAEEAPDLLGGLRSALQSDDALKVQQAAHKLAGALLTVSGNRAAELARSIENAARGNDISQVESQLQKLAAELDALREAFVAAGDLPRADGLAPAATVENAS